MRALQLLGADVAEHDAECEEAEHADHQQDVHDSLRLSVDPACSPVLHSLLGSEVLGRPRGRQEACAVEAVLQDGEKERLQLGAVGVGHG